MRGHFLPKKKHEGPGSAVICQNDLDPLRLDGARSHFRVSTGAWAGHLSAVHILYLLSSFFIHVQT